MLTTGADVSGILVGSATTTSTDGDDTFTATNLTYGAGDVLLGGTGTDVMNITATGAVGAATSVVGIETINVNSSGIYAASYDAAGVVGVGTTINAANAVASGTFAITNLGTGATVGASGVTGALSVTTAASASQTLTLAANMASAQNVTLTGSGAADTATLAAAGAVNLTITGVETANLSGNGAAVTHTVTGTAGQTINLTGSQDVTLSGTSATFTGSTVTDSTTAGTTTVKITATTDKNDLSKVAADVIEITGATADDGLIFKASGANVTVSQANKLDLISTSLTDTATTDSITILASTATTSLGNADGGTGGVAGTAGAYETVNYSASVDNAATLTLGAGTALNLSGSKAITLAATSTAKSVDATGMTGVLSVTYDNGTDIATVTGGSGNDIFTNATTAIGTQVTINGGAGNDTFTMLSTAKAVIDGGEGTGDKLVLAGTNDASNLVLSNVEVISLTGTGIASFKASQINGKTYIVSGDATADKIIVGGAAGLVDSATIDLSQLTLDTANVTNTEVTVTDNGHIANTLALGASYTITGTGVIDTVNISNLTGANTISTGAGADVITGGTGADTITGGEGSDVITGGNGLDTINLTETTAAEDKVVTGSLAANADTIIGFAAGSGADILDLSAPLAAATLTIGTQIAYTDTKATNIAAVTTAANTDAPVYYIANTKNGAGVMTIAEIETAITAGSAATGETVVLIDDGTDTFVYFDLAAETDAGSGAGMILVATLVGVTGATALATGDLISV
jgi:hypothetical protein